MWFIARNLSEESVFKLIEIKQSQCCYYQDGLHGLIDFEDQQYGVAFRRVIYSSDYGVYDIEESVFLKNNNETNLSGKFTKHCWAEAQQLQILLQHFTEDPTSYSTIYGTYYTKQVIKIGYTNN